MNGIHTDMVMMPVETLNELAALYIGLMNDMQERGHDLRDVVTVGFYALGAATAQGGGIIPEALLLKDLQPFTDGYANGLGMLRKGAQ